MSLEYTSKGAIERKHAAVVNGFHKGITLDLEFRRHQLRNLYYAILDNEKELKQALYVDLHRPGNETEILELNEVLSEAALAIAKLDKWAADESLPTLTGDSRFALGKAVLRKTPYGASLIIGPWNYPYLCTITPLISAIAAGNTVVLKPTEVAVESTRVLTRVLEDALDPSVFQVVVGGVEETTQLLALKWDKIMLTGSNRVGQVVAHAAANQLTPITLELGGKSPAIITRKANLAISARRIAWGKLVNAGQTCIAPDYIIIDKDVSDEFAKHFKAAVRSIYPGMDSSTEGKDFAHIISDRLFERATDLVAKSDARDVWQWGKPNRSTRFYPPTLLQGVTPEDITMKEELFMPVLPVLEVSDAASEAPQIITSGHDHPLALYVFSSDQAETDRLLNRTRSGAAMVNDCVQQGGSPIIPFGGVGPSGSGRYHGKYGFDEFTFERPVVVQPTWVETVLKARYAPYTSTNTHILRAVSRPMYPSFGRTGRVGPTRWSWLWTLLVRRLGIVLAILLAFFHFSN